MSRGKFRRNDCCHEDPMFGSRRRCAFGPARRAHSHLSKQGVEAGDVFLFFGLFSDEHRKDRHHRIFGYLKVKSIDAIGPRPKPHTYPGFVRPHPHSIGEWGETNAVYLGEGAIARHASSRLRLTAPGSRTSIWRVPTWLRRTGLTWHARDDRWLDNGLLQSVARGQEFVANIGDNKVAHRWVDQIIEEINR